MFDVSFSGILNSEELSLINGSFSKSSGESLSSIQEEDPLYDSSDLQALEDKLFKEVPKAASNKDKKAAPSSAVRRTSLVVEVFSLQQLRFFKFLKFGSLSEGKLGLFNLRCLDSQARRKVLSAHDVNISGSKRSGCPRPVASPSYPL